MACVPEVLVVGAALGRMGGATTVVIAEEVAGMMEEAVEVGGTAAAVWAAQAKVVAAEVEAAEMAVAEALADTLAGVDSTAAMDTTAEMARALEAAVRAEDRMDVVVLALVARVVVAAVGVATAVVAVVGLAVREAAARGPRWRRHGMSCEPHRRDCRSS